MAKTSFKDMSDKKTPSKKATTKRGKPAPEAEAELAASEEEETLTEDSASIIPATSNAIAPQAGCVEGDFDNEDLIVPRINVVGKTGNLSDQFSPGSLVLNKEFEVVEKEEDLEIVVLAFAKKYQEDTDFDSEEMGRVFNNKHEMLEAGYQCTDYDGEGFCQPMANFILLAKKPEAFEDEIGLFTFEAPDGSEWGMFEMTCAKTAYKTTGKEVATFLTINRGRATPIPLHKAKWNLKTGLKRFRENSWWSPFFKRAGTLDDELYEFVKELVPQG